MKRLAVLLGSMALFVLLAEGLLSLSAGRSLRRLGRAQRMLEGLEQQTLGDREATLAALRTRGPYRTAPDALVRLTYRAVSEVEVAGQRFATDELGLARRHGGPPPEDAFHIVLLGDSIAFGQGLAAGENLAAQLEGLLREVAGPGAPAIACSTVALPGWNARNSTRALLDHLDRFAPDVVLFMPVQNDLDDSFATNEAGHRQRSPDPAVPHPLCVVAPPLGLFQNMGREVLGLRRMARSERSIEDWALFGMLTETARWRLDDMVAHLVLLARRLEANGARLVLAPYAQHDLHRLVRARLVARGLDLPVLPLLERLLAADGQGRDPHPNAETTRALAIWCAAGLLEQGLVPLEAVRPLPAVPSGFADRQGQELEAAALLAWAERRGQEESELLEARIAPAELAGFLQIYGGVNADGTLGVDAACVLPPGRRLALELAAALEAPGLYPLQVDLAIDGEHLGTLELEHATAQVRREFELPPGAALAPFELRFEARDWALGRVRGRRMPVVAHLLSVESLP